MKQYAKSEKSIVHHVFALLFITIVCCLAGSSSGATFQSQWDQTFDRVWPGPEYWSNPMEDWCIRDGWLECKHKGGNRNVHVLTHGLGQRTAGFSLSVRLGLAERGQNGSAGFRIGVHDQYNDYRGNVLWGTGIDAGVTIDGKLKLGGKTKEIAGLPMDDLQLKLVAQPAGSDYALMLTAIEPSTGNELGTLSADIAAERLIGNLALVNNFEANMKQGSRFWFADWQIEGDKIEADDSHVFGPILWAMHTLSDSRNRDDRYVMKMTAQMPPLGDQDSNEVELQIQEADAWKTLGTEKIDSDACIATFRIPNWLAGYDIPYRLVYKMRQKGGTTVPYYWTGTIRHDPLDKTLVFAGMTCQFHSGFPYPSVVKNLKALNPDVMYFSGDQIYEGNGHYGIVRTPADRSILNFLRKWYLFGWAFGDLMRDRPTLCTPDDHDVFQGNIWGNAGNPVSMEMHNAGGYAQPARMVRVVNLVNTAHHPDMFDPAPIDQGIPVFYGDMVYGRTSFAVVSDRMFKSGPRGTVADWEGRPDHVKDDAYDVSNLDKPGLVLLGDRQLKFLEHWVQDWRRVDMKMFLSQTVFANVATHHGNRNGYLRADLDSGGWPQSARNRAISVIRKGFPLHVSGDQHLTTLLQYGVDQQRDSNWSLCTPAITVMYQRWWLPDELGLPYKNRPSHGLPNTGEYLDGVNNKVFVYALGNPEGSRDPDRLRQAHIRASGFSIVRLDHDARTYTCESYKFSVDVTDNKADDQFSGFPYTIKQLDNYGRKPYGYLQEFTADGMADPIVKVYDEETDELLYAIRAKGKRFRPWVFGEGKYTVRIGDQDKALWHVFVNQTIQERCRDSNP